jgi:DNA-binding NtrC family response regulator
MSDTLASRGAFDALSIPPEAKPTIRILVVDDERTLRDGCTSMLQADGYNVSSAGRGDEAIDMMRRSRFDIVLVDLHMTPVSGMEVVAGALEANKEAIVIVITGNPSVATSIEALRAGAWDYLPKPFSATHLHILIGRAAHVILVARETRDLRRQGVGDSSNSDKVTLLGTAPAFRSAVELARRVAETDASVMITGESGTGKEVVAQFIHRHSRRASRSLVSINCAALPANLLESELFGHVKGAFTGASAEKRGLFEEADGGTLFLDEIGELPLDAQVKLLRALQQGEIDPVGGKQPVKVDFRLISATNQNLISLVNEGRFREDLFYRLNVFPIWVPPLRERLEDVPELIRHFIARFAAEEGKRIDGIDADASAMLQSYTWPGNIRQLENAVFRAIVLADTPMLTVNEFPQIAAHVEGYQVTVPPAPAPKDPVPRIEGPVMLGESAGAPATIHVPSANGKDAIGIPALSDSGDIRSLEAVEADMIRLAFGRYRGRMTEIAKRLGIGRSTLYRKMREIGLEVRP